MKKAKSGKDKKKKVILKTSSFNQGPPTITFSLTPKALRKEAFMANLSPSNHL